MSGVIDATLPTENLARLEQLKFSTDADTGDVIIRTSAKGESSVLGLRVGGLITEVALNDSTWTPLPATPLANRNALSIQNKSSDQIKINYDNSVVGYTGIYVENGEERFYSIKDTIIIYAKSAPGTTPTVVVEELA